MSRGAQVLMRRKKPLCTGVVAYTEVKVAG
jgi:hypothetical protein